jgi:hypothetical protein
MVKSEEYTTINSTFRSWFFLLFLRALYVSCVGHCILERKDLHQAPNPQVEGTVFVYQLDIKHISSILVCRAVT